MRVLWDFFGHTQPKMPKWSKNHWMLFQKDPKIIDFFQKVSTFDALKTPKKKTYIGKRRSRSKSQKITMKLTNINFEVILRPFWHHLGVPGRALGAILGILEPTWAYIKWSGATLEPTWNLMEPTYPNLSQHKPTWSPRNPSGWL